MNRIRVTVFLLLALSAASLYGQAKPRLAILPFTGGSPEDAETIAEFFSYEDEINRVFTPVPRTRAIENLMKEQQFQRSGLTDSDTIADLGKELGADYVLAGHIAVLGGSSKLLLITIIDVKELQQIAGAYQEYQRIESVIDVMPGMAKQITGAAVRDSSALPRLAVLPFNVLSSGMDLGDAELLAQLLAIELVKSGVFAVFPRTRAIEKVMEEHHIERSGMTDAESIKAIGKAVNAQYVLSANVRMLGADNYFSASVLDIVDASQGKGTREKYQSVNDGLTLMPRIAQVLSGTGSITVRSGVAGTVVVNGRNTGVNVKEGSTAVVSNVNAGTVPVAIQMAGGQLVQGPSVTVEAGQTVDVRIERPAPVAPVPSNAGRAQARPGAAPAIPREPRPPRELKKVDPIETSAAFGFVGSPFTSGGTVGWDFMTLGIQAGIHLQSSNGFFLNILGDAGAGYGMRLEADVAGDTFVSYYCGGSVEILLLKYFLIGTGGGMTGAGGGTSGWNEIIPFSPYIRGSWAFSLSPDDDYQQMSVKVFYDYIFDYGYRLGAAFNMLVFFN
jgi:TolB-like protein